MTTAAKNKKKPAPAPAPALKPEAPKTAKQRVADALETAKQRVADALETYFSLENAVHAIYLLDGEIEITTARERLAEALEEIELEVPEVDLDAVLSFIKRADDEETQDAILGALDIDNLIAFMGDKLERFDKDDLSQALKGEFNCLVRFDSLLQRNKLEEFLRTEIWPTDGLYKENVIL